MNRKVICFMLTLVVLFIAPVSYSQIFNKEWGVGVDFGAQRFYGDMKNNSIGLGIEGLVNYKILNFAYLSFALGYSQLKYNFILGTSNTTNIINTDLKGDFEILSKGMIRPYLTLGVGLFTFQIGKRFWQQSAFGGGGLKFKVNSQFDGFFGADYRFTTTDALDAWVSGKSNDGYLNVRAGMIYNLSNKDESTPDVIASEMAPIDEVNNDLPFTQEQHVVSANNNMETKNMEEYVKLKSKIDALSQNVNMKENEIERLQSSLNDRKHQLAIYEKKAEKQPKRNIAKTSSMSGFSEIYEEALTNYYNKNYTESVSLFKMLLQQYPNHSLTSNCQYWIGQSLFALNRFQESIDAFNKVLAYNRSFKKDDALFQLGKSYLKLGMGDKAKESFTRLIREYPNSEHLDVAKNYIGRL